MYREPCDFVEIAQSLPIFQTRPNSKKYDIIIGNPPWQSNITEKTKAYLKESEDKFLVGLTKMAARKIPAAIVFMRI